MLGSGPPGCEPYFFPTVFSVSISVFSGSVFVFADALAISHVWPCNGFLRISFGFLRVSFRWAKRFLTETHGTAPM